MGGHLGKRKEIRMTRRLQDPVTGCVEGVSNRKKARISRLYTYIYFFNLLRFFVAPPKLRLSAMERDIEKDKAQP